MKSRKTSVFAGFSFGAGNRNRTCTENPPDPKSGASASSAIPAYFPSQLYSRRHTTRDATISYDRLYSTWLYIH